MPLPSITAHSTISYVEVASKTAATLCSQHASVGSEAVATLCGNDAKRLVGPEYKQCYINTHQNAYIHSYLSIAHIHADAHR